MTETKSPILTAEHNIKAATNLKTKFTTSYIAVSSGVMRNNQLKEHAKEIDSIVRRAISEHHPYINYIDVDNLDDPALFFDGKHYKRGRGVARLARNIIIEIRKALGYTITPATSRSRAPSQGPRSYLL